VVVTGEGLKVDVIALTVVSLWSLSSFAQVGVVIVVGVPLWAAAVGIVVEWGGGGYKWVCCHCRASPVPPKPPIQPAKCPWEIIGHCGRC